MVSHDFSFEGGDILSKIGATWLVSYAFYERIDRKHKNWANVSTCDSRISMYNKSRKYHKFWLEQVLIMNPNKLRTNKIELDSSTTKAMAKQLLEVWKE